MFDSEIPAELIKFDADWPSAINSLSGEMHPVDRDACSIWFQFYPLDLRNLLQATPDRSILEGFYKFRGIYCLAEIADTSHSFLYSHHYWPLVKQALGGYPRDASLVETIRTLASKVDAPLDLSLPISAIGLMTLRQVGSWFLQATYNPPVEIRTLEQVLQSRASDLKTGWFSKPKLRVVLDERSSEGWFPLIQGQHITTAAERDLRPHHETNGRCSIGNGPIPVDCRSGTCGTCWIGVLGGNGNLAAVDSFERKRMQYFGYWESPFHQDSDAKPLIRLACQSVATGSCSIVIPPWNGVWSESRRTAFARQERRPASSPDHCK